MKLFVLDGNKKIYIGHYARTKNELAQRLGTHQFRLLANNRIYNVNQVRAEKTVDNSAAGMIVGGMIGILGGPLGIIGGGLLGAAAGQVQNNNEDTEVNLFNKSVA